MDAVLKVNNLSKKIKNCTIVNNVSFTLEKGDILGFLGPNGAGKSTTIKMILGLVKPSNGDVYICDYNIAENREKALKKVGAMVETPTFYGYMSGVQNIELYANLYSLDKKRVNEVLELVGLSNDKDKKVKNYSMGMKQRLGIARAFLNHPDIIILDEPTNGLDPVGIIEIRQIIKDLAKNRNISFLVSSHILSEMETICNKVLIINKGGMIANGNTASLLKENNCDSLENYYLHVLGKECHD